MDVAAALSAVDAALSDGDAEVSIGLGRQREEVEVRARLWRGQVLVDWEPDASAGGCLLRPHLLRRLVALHAPLDVKADGNILTMTASGRIMAALSPEHAGLVAALGGAECVQLRVRLRFADGAYRGGDETYALVEDGARATLLRVSARVSRRTSPATR